MNLREKEKKAWLGGAVWSKEKEESDIIITSKIKIIKEKN